MTWLFSEDFRAGESQRVERLGEWRSYEQITQVIVASSTLMHGTVKWRSRHVSDRSIERVQFAVTADVGAVDALFNSAQGYRAQYVASVLAGEAANERIVGELWRRHRREVVSRLDRDPAHADVSMTAPQAKVWFEQDERVNSALREDQRTTPIEIAVSEWLRRIDERSHRGSCLARAGVLATSSAGVVRVKGSWLKRGEPWADPRKACRSYQIALYGFS
jgi:hypothetical protein